MDSFLNSYMNNASSVNNCNPEKGNLYIKCGNYISTIIPPNTPGGSTFTLSAITINPYKNTQLIFQCNINNLAFLGSINFEVFKLCIGKTAPTKVGSSWLFSRSTQINDSNIFTLFACDNIACIDKCCTYIIVATVYGVPSLTINGVTNGILSFLVNGNSNTLIIYRYGISSTYSGGHIGVAFFDVNGTVLINNLTPTAIISQNGTDVSIDNWGIGTTASLINADVPYTVVYASSDNPNNTTGNMIIRNVNGTITQSNSTSGTLTISNSSLSALSI